MVMLFLSHRYRSMQANGIIHRAKWTGVGNDGMVKMVSLYAILYSYDMFGLV